MFQYIINGLFTDVYYTESIKILLASYVTEQNNPGVRNKIKFNIERFFRSKKLYEYKIICNEENNKEPHLLLVDVILKPTKFSETYKWIFVLKLQNWDNKLLQNFSGNDFINIYNDADVHYIAYTN